MPWSLEASMVRSCLNYVIDCSDVTLLHQLACGQADSLLHQRHQGVCHQYVGSMQATLAYEVMSANLTLCRPDTQHELVAGSVPINTHPCHLLLHRRHESLRDDRYDPGASVVYLHMHKEDSVTTRRGQAQGLGRKHRLSNACAL